MRRRPREDVLATADAWFRGNGLPYFVPEERAEVRAALQPGRLWPALLVLAVVGLGGGAVLAWLADTFSLAPALLLALLVGGGVLYALTALRARPIVGWALSHTLVSLRSLLPMLSRALPLLLLFVTFLFINAEVWQMSASLSPGQLWLVVLLFVAIAVAFLLVRLPEEVDRVDDDVDEVFLRRACRGTPVEAECERLLADPAARPQDRAEVFGFERANLVLALLVVQAAQIALMALAVFGFFLVFGALVMDNDVVGAWIDTEGPVLAWRYLPTLSVQLVQVAIFLSAFSALYLTVSTVTDETYRAQFFGGVQRHLERAVGVRAVYLALREERERTAVIPVVDPVVDEGGGAEGGYGAPG